MKRACLMLSIGIGILALDVQAQTLADFARSERARQGVSRSRVFTNDDVSSGVSAPPQQTAPPPAAATTEEAAADKPVGPTDNQGRGEQYWRNAFATARTELKRAEDQRLVLELKRNELNTEMLRQSDVYNRENVIRVALNALEIELAAARRQVDTAVQKLADLEEELRRSAGLPGWAR